MNTKAGGILVRTSGDYSDYQIRDVAIAQRDILEEDWPEEFPVVYDEMYTVVYNLQGKPFRSYPDPNKIPLKVVPGYAYREDRWEYAVRKGWITPVDYEEFFEENMYWRKREHEQVR